MPALLAYIVAISLLVGGGYAGLRWLAEPEPVVRHAGKESPKNKQEVRQENRRDSTLENTQIAGQAQLPADPDRGSTYGLGPSAGGAQSKPVSEAPKAADDPGQIAPAPTEQRPAKQTAKDTAKDAAEVPRGGCMPFGITENGELVFPMECQALLAQYGAGAKTPELDSADSSAASEQAGTQAETRSGTRSETADDSKVR